MDAGAVAALDDRVLGPQHKGLPREAWGKTVREFLRTGPTLDADVDAVADRRSGRARVECVGDGRLGPVGGGPSWPRTARRRWRRRSGRGSSTPARGGSPWPPRGRCSSPGRSASAGSCSPTPIVDPVALAWLAAELDADPSFEFFSWADSVQTVELMDRRPRIDPEWTAGQRDRGAGRAGRAHRRAHRRVGPAVAAAIHRSTRLTLGRRRRIRGRAES